MAASAAGVVPGHAAPADCALNYAFTVQKATAVTHSVVGNFTSPSEVNLITACVERAAALPAAAQRRRLPPPRPPLTQSQPAPAMRRKFTRLEIHTLTADGLQARARARAARPGGWSGRAAPTPPHSRPAPRAGPARPRTCLPPPVLAIAPLRRRRGARPHPAQAPHRRPARCSGARRPARSPTPAPSLSAAPSPPLLRQGVLDVPIYGRIAVLELFRPKARARTRARDARRCRCCRRTALGS